MTDLKELKRVFLEVREKLVAESHRLMSDLNGCFEGDYEHALGTIHRMLDVFEGLKILSNHSESFLGALEAEDRVAEAKTKLKRQLLEFAAPLSALKKHRDALRTANLEVLQKILTQESGHENIEIRIPEDIDPTVVGLIELFPDVLGEAATFSAAAAEAKPGLDKKDEIDDNLDEDKAALARALAAPDEDDEPLVEETPPENGISFAEEAALAAVASAEQPEEDEVVEGAVTEATENLLDDIFSGENGEASETSEKEEEAEDPESELAALLAGSDD